MNKLLTFEGGQPFTTGDLDFLQQCYAGALKALCRSLSAGTDCILHGILSDGQPFGGSISPGAVCIDGEVLFVTEAKSGTGKYLCFRTSTSEEREFYDAQSHRIYQTAEAYISSVTEGAYKHMDLTQAKMLPDILSGEAFWMDNTAVTFPSGVTGRVESNERLKYHRITLSKSAGEDNLLFNYPSTSAHNPLTGLAVDTDTNKAYAVKMSIGACRVYNADGTPYNGTLSFTNVIIK